MFVIIHDPDRETIDDIDALLNSLEFDTKISQIELTIDFYTHTDMLKKFFLDHLFLPYHRKGCRTVGRDEVTNYIGNTRKQSKAIRLYPKTIDAREALRLEPVLNRPNIEKLNLALPLENIDSIDLSKFIFFKRLNAEKLFNSMLPKYKHYFSKGDCNASLRGRVRLSVERSWILRAPTLMEKVVRVKAHYASNYARFFIDMPGHNIAFYALLTDRCFLADSNEIPVAKKRRRTTPILPLSHTKKRKKGRLF